MTETNASEETVFQFDSLFQPEFVRAPQPYYRHMRDTNPALRTESMYGDGSSMVFLAKHEDIEFALRNPEIFSSKFNRDGDPLVPINFDPPKHIKYRRVLDPIFGPKPMRKLEAEIVRRANDLIDAFIDKGECDFADDFAVPLPCQVFLDLMGFPMEDLPDFLRLKEAVLRGGGGGMMDQGDQVRIDARAEATERFTELINARRKDPQDDFLTAIVNSEIDGEPISQQDLLGICHLLLVAGLDTVTDSLTCFYAFLAQNPEYRQRIVDDPGLIPDAIEEMLRFESPVPFVPRVVQKDTELSGCPLHAGDSVVLLLGSANTDEKAFDDAETVNFDREASSRHLAFGGGLHRCLGSHLARIELRVGVSEWHRRIPQYHIPEGVELEWATMLRQVEHLPVVFDEVVA